MTRAFFELLILLKFILYSKYESRHRRRQEGHKRAYSRPSQSNCSYSSVNTVKSTFSEMTSEGHLRYLSALLVNPNSLVSSHRIQRLV